MKITAMYKCWSAEDWLPASVASIYDHVDNIVLLTSDTSWIGQKGNPSIGTVKQLAQLDKVIHLHENIQDQIEHCEHGYQWIRTNLKPDVVMLIDSDELWDAEELTKAKELIKQTPKAEVFRTISHTHIKTPFIRILPVGSQQPVCFVRTSLERSGRYVRFGGMPSATLSVHHHHFSFVRRTFNEVLEKNLTSHIVEKQPYADMSRWIPEVWNKLPNPNKALYPKGFNMAEGHEEGWRAFERLTINDLPQTLNEFPELLRYGS